MSEALNTSDALKLAQVTDLHLGPLPRTPLRLLNLKRTTGTLNWYRSRRHVHDQNVVDRLVADLRSQGADHFAVTGDLCNIGLPDEHARAERWLHTVGAPEDVSVIPGNHDIYSSLRGDVGVGRWAAFMRSCDQGQAMVRAGAVFPTVRILRQGGTRIALIGLNSAIETPPLVAAGALGTEQLERLAIILRETRLAGLGRVVMIHHPPLPGQAKRDRGLRDAERLRDVLVAEGAELVIHGHNHQTMFARLESAHGGVPVVGAPSSSAAVAHGREPLGQAHLFTLVMIDGRAVVDLAVRGLGAGGGIEALGRRRLSVG